MVATSVSPDLNGAFGSDARLRVVIAEDSYLIREVLTMTLGAIPSVTIVAVCTNGKELLSAIDTWHPDVVLTDIRMPPTGTDEGIRVAARLRETHPEIGVVVLSQYAEPALRARRCSRADRRPRLPAQGAHPRPRRARSGDRGGGPRRLGDRPQGRRGLVEARCAPSTRGWTN